MTRRILNYSRPLVAAMFAAVAILMFATSALASGHRRVIYSFQGPNGDSPDGEDPVAGLVADSAGNLYGTTYGGGTNSACSCGTVFELIPPAIQGQQFSETILYSFVGGTGDGSGPSGTLIFDALGNLYGTTQGGGPNNTGTVFELTPPITQGGAWTETVLLIFPADLSKGYWPFGKLTFDSLGNLYGTTLFGGSGSNCTNGIGECGTVFRLKAPATRGGAWTQTVIHNFGEVAGDGFNPGSGLIYRRGFLYGTTENGGSGANGTVYLLAPNHGSWIENILYNFTGSEGSSPVGGLILDSAGNLHGTVQFGGNSNCLSGCGGVFELSPPAVSGNPWQETTLYSFTGGKDGNYPLASLIRDKSGNLYGTASHGGLNNATSGLDHGTIFELSPPTVSGGAWTETTLHDFAGGRWGDGSGPHGELILVNGKFYGTTVGGGAVDAGIAFSLVIAPQ